VACIAIDLGGTNTRIAGRIRFPTFADYDKELAAIVEATRPMRPDAVGVSFGGRLDADGQRVKVSLNLRGYEGRHLRDDLAEALACPVRVAHDATCGLLGEYTSGSLQGVDRCAYVTLSTGVGSAVRLGDGKQAVVLTTEAGHQLIAGNVLPCVCGQRGCLETLAGGRALELRLGRSLEDVNDEDFWRRYAEAVAPGLANVALVAGVEAIALGGAIVLRRPGLFERLAAEVARRATYQQIQLTPAQLGENAPLVGAAALFEQTVLH
jgi:glucokinase